MHAEHDVVLANPSICPSSYAASFLTRVLACNCSLP